MTDILAGKVAVVTGSGQGIGAAIARILAGEGAAVVTNSRLEVSTDGTSTAADTAREIVGAGGEATAVYADAGAAEGSRQLIDAAMEQFGSVDILVNNAGGGAQPGGTAMSKSLEDISLAEWEESLRSNATGQFLCTQLAAPHMVASGWGRVVNLGSSAGLVGIPNMSSYSAAKGAVHGLTLALAKEYLGRGVTVNCVLPSAGTVRSDRNRAEREKLSGFKITPDPLRTPEGVAPLVLYLCSEAAADVTGQILFAGGGRVTLYRWPPPATTVVRDSHWTVDDLGRTFARHFGSPLLPPPLDA